MTRTKIIIVLLATSALSMTACSSERVARLSAALSRADISLADSVAVAEAETSGGLGTRAALDVTAEPVFSIDAIAAEGAKQVHVDIVSGRVLSLEATPASSASCPGSISLSEALAIAEERVHGEAVQIQSDDDNACDREVQVLAGSTLWEVKIAPSGTVLEVEESDDD